MSDALKSQLAHKQATINTLISERDHFQTRTHELEAELKEQRMASGKMIRDLQRELENEVARSSYPYAVGFRRQEGGTTRRIFHSAVEAASCYLEWAQI